MSTKKHLIFFFLDDFHRGAANHVLHFTGFTFLGYGLGKPSLLLIILSPFIRELGHLYNYFRGTHRGYAVKVIPLRLLAWAAFVGLGYFIARIVGY